MRLDARFERSALVVGGVGAAALALGALTSGMDQFFRSYLVGVIFWIAIAFGCLGIQLIHTISSGRWGVLARGPLHAASSTMPLLGLFFLPLLAGLSRLYPWARADVVAHDELLRHKSLFLNAPFFIARAVLYFAVWSGLALSLYRRAARRGSKEGASRGMRTIAGPGILASGLTMTFAAIDWLMSLEPHWSSTMFGLLVIIGALLSGMAFTIVIVTSLSRDAKDEPPLSIDALHDLGNLMLVFVMLWAYFSYSQYLIIYGGNLAEEVPWYVQRTAGGWQYMALGLIVLHFAVPFTVLLSRRTKRSPETIRGVALGLLAMRLVELFWFVAPNFYGREIRVHWMDVAAPVAIGGLWLFAFSRRMAGFQPPARTLAPAT